MSRVTGKSRTRRGNRKPQAVSDSISKGLRRENRLARKRGMRPRNLADRREEAS